MKEYTAMIDLNELRDNEAITYTGSTSGQFTANGSYLVWGSDADPYVIDDKGHKFHLWGERLAMFRHGHNVDNGIVDRRAKIVGTEVSVQYIGRDAADNAKFAHVLGFGLGAIYGLVPVSAFLQVISDDDWTANYMSDAIATLCDDLASNAIEYVPPGRSFQHIEKRYVTAIIDTIKERAWPDGGGETINVNVNISGAINRPQFAVIYNVGRYSPVSHYGSASINVQDWPDMRTGVAEYNRRWLAKHHAPRALTFDAYSGDDAPTNGDDSNDDDAIQF